MAERVRPPAATRQNELLRRRFVALSLAAHMAIAGAALLWWLPRPQSREVPATIQVLFGDNADVAGSPAPSSARPQQETVPDTAGTAPDADAGTRPPASQTPPADSAPPKAAPLPVRLGEGELGLKLSDPPDAGMIEAKADPGNRAPKYPPIAWQQRQHGTVVIRLHIDTLGRVVDAEVLESSGFPSLDLAARQALAKWHFVPALQDGVAVPSFRDQATNFVLE